MVIAERATHGGLPEDRTVGVELLEPAAGDRVGVVHEVTGDLVDQLVVDLELLELVSQCRDLVQ
jgi:hypothetical protein